MILIILALALQAAAPPPPEAEALGRRLADTGTLATLLPLQAAKETEELVAAHPELDAAGKAVLRATAAEIAARDSDRLLAAEGHAYAAALSLPDLRLLVAFAEGDAAKRYRAAGPGVIVMAMKAAAGIDYKGDTLAAFCAKTGKACPAK